MFLSLKGQTKEKRIGRGRTPPRPKGDSKAKCFCLEWWGVQWRKWRVCRNLVILIWALSLDSITNSGKVTEPNCPDFL